MSWIRLSCLLRVMGLLLFHFLGGMDGVWCWYYGWENVYLSIQQFSNLRDAELYVSLSLHHAKLLLFFK